MLTGDVMTTGMVALFFGLFLLAFIWALFNRQFQDLEQVKFKLLEDDDETFKPL